MKKSPDGKTTRFKRITTTTSTPPGFAFLTGIEGKIDRLEKLAYDRENKINDPVKDPFYKQAREFSKQIRGDLFHLINKLDVINGFIESIFKPKLDEKTKNASK